MDIWVVGTLNQLFIVLKLKQNFQKNKKVIGKTSFFVIDPFCTHHSIFLTLSSDMTVLYRNDAFFNLSTFNQKTVL